jgi:hypothetical protein
MSEGDRPRGYLAKYGARLIDAGYRIIPIRRGEKTPRGEAMKKWTQITADKRLLRTWLEASYAKSGVGIQARDNPAVDIDVRDPEVASALEEFVHARVGLGPVRVGRPPKRLIVFRTDNPFPKITSSAYVDGDGNKAQVEILGDGQQFVAFAIHPDTNKPYEWLYKDGPHVTESDDLPTLSEPQARAVIAEFERLAEERGWELKRSARQTALIRSGEVDRDDPFADFAEKTTITDEELHKRLLLVDNADDYETWTNVGMGLYHQFDGSDQGLEWWHEWSSQAQNYDSDVLDAKWPTFAIESKKRQPITARIILKLAKEQAEEQVREALQEITSDLGLATDIVTLRKVAERAKQIELDPFTRNQLVGILQTRYKAITNQVLPVGMARDMVRFEQKARQVPKWLEGYVYCQMDEIFYSRTKRHSLSTQAFNQAFGRHLLTDQEKAEGKAVPEIKPADAALNLYEIPVVYSRFYLPGEDELFRLNGVAYVNSYDGRNVPTVPETLTAADRRNTAMIEAHFEHLFTSTKDRRVLLDALAFIVQNPGKRLNWAILMQGTEGDGKTFVFRLMACVLGLENVTTIGAQAIEEKFTPWAEGNQFVFVEEIKLQGHNRHDVLNRVKPLITNEMVPIRRMNVDTYMVFNTSNYFMATNHRDALPLNDNDSRYFVLFSRFQTKAQIRAFIAENPTYYDDLHEALNESPGAIRKWLLDWEVSKSFRPLNRAPDSEAKRVMVDFAKSDEERCLEEIIAGSPRLDMTRQLLNATDLAEEFDKQDVQIPYGRALNKLLIDAGFTRVGKVWTGSKAALYWTQTPERFIDSDGRPKPNRIREWLEDEL